MFGHSLKYKIILPIAIILTLLVVIMTASSSSRLSNFANILFDDRAVVTANTLAYYLEDCRSRSKVAAFSAATHDSVKNAVQERDSKEILNVLKSFLELSNVDFCIITDENGAVLTRTYSPYNSVDYLTGNQCVENALQGIVCTCFIEGNLIKVSCRTSAPIYGADGTLIGTVTAGVRLDTAEALFALKNHSAAEFSLYWDDIRVASTIADGQGRLIGDRMNPSIAKTVIGEGKEYFGVTEVLGASYSTYFMPLFDSDNHVFAVLAAGHSNTFFNMQKNEMLFSGLLIGIIGLIISIAVLMFATFRALNPVKRLGGLVSELAKGNMDVQIDESSTSGEIGEAISDIYSLIDVTKSMTSDVAQLITELTVYGDIDSHIDASGYSGTYRDIIGGIETLGRSVSTMRKTMAAMDYLDTMISVVDFDYNLLYVNRSMADTYGFDREACIGKKCYKVIRNLDEPCSICQLQKLLESRESLPFIDYENLYEEKSKSYVGGRAAVIRWVDGEKVFFNSLKDETIKMQHQEGLRKAAEEAEAASIAKSTFLANMSHELRTPLNAVIGLTDLQLTDESISDSLKENLYKISNAGSTLLSIVNDILDISKIDSGNFTLMPVEYHLASLLNDTVFVTMLRIKEKPIEFRLDIGADLPNKLFGDDLRVKQILNNLLSNSAKYTNEGTIELYVHCDRAKSGDVIMEITVKDTGIGIKPEDMEGLFEEYNQVNNKANRKIMGTGLGLPITKRLVESMGGAITVESEYGKGSTFSARILQGFVSKATIGDNVVENLRNFRYIKNKHYHVSGMTFPDLSHARVLVVDDMQANLDVSEGLLRKYKIRVDCLTDGQAAIERIRRGEPVYDAVFMDHMMPEMDGIEAADKIRALETDYAKNIPIIALTANAVMGTDEQFYKHNFQAFLTKPVDIMRLDAVIQQWVKKSSDSGLPESDMPDQCLPEPELSEPHYKIEIPDIDTKKGLFACGGELKTYTSVLRSYIADVSLIIDKISDVTEETLPCYTVLVHGVKGSSAIIGAENMREIAADLEAMAKEGDLPGILSRNAAFIGMAEKLLDNIKEWLDKNAGETKKPQLAAPDPVLLSKLRLCCEQYDLDGAEKIMDELESADYQNNSDLVRWLREKIDIMDFSEVVGATGFEPVTSCL